MEEPPKIIVIELNGQNKYVYFLPEIENFRNASDFSINVKADE